MCSVCPGGKPVSYVLNIKVDFSLYIVSTANFVFCFGLLVQHVKDMTVGTSKINFTICSSCLIRTTVFLEKGEHYNLSSNPVDIPNRIVSRGNLT